MMNKTNKGKGVANAHGPLTMACNSHQWQLAKNFKQQYLVIASNDSSRWQTTMIGDGKEQ